VEAAAVVSVVRRYASREASALRSDSFGPIRSAARE
jgi:hypothetical protein